MGEDSLRSNVAFAAEELLTAKGEIVVETFFLVGGLFNEGGKEGAKASTLPACGLK